MHLWVTQKPGVKSVANSRGVKRVVRQLNACLQVGSLEAKRDVTDVRDAAPVLVQLAALGGAGEAYNVASGPCHCSG